MPMSCSARSRRGLERMASGVSMAESSIQIGALATGRGPVQVGKLGRGPRERALARVEMLDPLHGRPDQLLQADEFLGALELRHLEDAVLGVIERFGGGRAPVVRILDDRGGGL